MTKEAPAPRKRIAFLRAINVGGHIVKMDRLRSIFAARGMTGVETFIASGNVMFDSAEADSAVLETQIEGFLQAELGYAVAAFLRWPAELAATALHARGIARGAADALYIGFLRDPPDASARTRLHALRTETDELRVHGREVFWHARTRMSDSKISGAVLEKALGCSMTVRNITTVNKLVAKYVST